jgi:hypothetical protein
MTRESGFYWVKLSLRGWEPAEYRADLEWWYVIGYGEYFLEKEFAEIGPRIFPPA